MTATTAGRAPAARSQGRVDRALAAVPLLTVFAWLALLYAWQAWLVRAPFIFPDELEYTQLARSLAESGEAARRGEPYGTATLPSLLTAPAWLIDDVRTAYFTVKLIGVVAMTAAVFPAYFLARELVGPRAALFAAAATGATPAFLYASNLVEEPFAYTMSTLCLLLVVRALARPTHWSIGLALAATVAAPLVRAQLAVIAAVFALSAAVLLWRSDALRQRRRSWTRWDYAGAITLLTGVVVVANELMSHRSFSWLVATRHYKDRMIDLGVAAGGAFTIGIGILPVVVGLALLARPPDATRTREGDSFRLVLGTSVAAFGFYGAVKAAYLSTLHGTYVYERNLIYLAPLFFVATALWMERARIAFVALAFASLAAALLLAHTPVILDHPYYEAPGFSILAAANRWLRLPGTTIAELLTLVLGVAIAFVAATMLLRGRPSARTAVAVLAGVLVLAWNVVGQLNVSAGARAAGSFMLQMHPEPVDWVDRAVGGDEVIFLGQGIRDPNPIHLLEFWNRSIQRMWSIDGTARGPGPTLTPDLGTADGTLSPDVGARYVVAPPAIDVAGEIVAEHNGLRLFLVEQPLGLRNAQSGVESDGWMVEHAAYSQYSTPGGTAGTMEVSLARTGCPETLEAATAAVRIGPLDVGPDRQPRLASVTRTELVRLTCGEGSTVRIPTPPPPFRVEVTVDRTFVPADVDPARSTDRRSLGAQVAFRFDAADG